MDILYKIFDTIYIPQAVSREIGAINSDEARKILSSIPHTIIEITNKTAVLGLLGRLHIGEVEVIVGAIEKGVPNVMFLKIFNKKILSKFGVIYIFSYKLNLKPVFYIKIGSLKFICA